MSAIQQKAQLVMKMKPKLNLLPIAEVIDHLHIMMEYCEVLEEEAKDRAPDFRNLGLLNSRAFTESQRLITKLNIWKELALAACTIVMHKEAEEEEDS